MCLYMYKYANICVYTHSYHTTLESLKIKLDGPFNNNCQKEQVRNRKYVNNKKKDRNEVKNISYDNK